MFRSLFLAAIVTLSACGFEALPPGTTLSPVEAGNAASSPSDETQNSTLTEVTYFGTTN